MSSDEVPLNVKVAAHQAAANASAPSPRRRPRRKNRRNRCRPLAAGYRRCPSSSSSPRARGKLAARRANQPEWTADFVLQNAKFCNIDRRDDAVTAELLAQLEHRRGGCASALLAAALRFTSHAARKVRARRARRAARARRREQQARRRSARRSTRTPSAAAPAPTRWRCRSGRWRPSSRRWHRRRRARRRRGAVADVQEASDVAVQHDRRHPPQLRRTRRPRLYVHRRLMQAASHHRCRLAPAPRRASPSSAPSARRRARRRRRRPRCAPSCARRRGSAGSRRSTSSSACERQARGVLHDGDQREQAVRAGGATGRRDGASIESFTNDLAGFFIHS